MVTIAPEEFRARRCEPKRGAFGEKKLQAASSMALGHGATLLLSGSVFNNAGEHSIYFPEANSPATNYGRAIDMNGEKGYHLFGNLHLARLERDRAVWRSRRRFSPSPGVPTVFNDRGTRGLDSRNFIDATYTHNFDASRSLQWRMYYDSYRFRGHFPLSGR